MVIDEGEVRSITITNFAPADEEATLAFCRQIFHEEGWPTEFMDPTIAVGFDRPRDLFLLVKLHGAIIGCGALKELSPDDALLTRFFIASSHRGSGLAARLFDALFERARELGYTTIVLDVIRIPGVSYRNGTTDDACPAFERRGIASALPGGGGSGGA
jgi:GNAT superfamily N-acetyltransferase